MTRKVAIAWAAEDTAAALHAQHRAEKVAEVRMRLHSLWLLCQGQGPTAVAAAVGVSRNSVQQWLRWYREGGLAEVRAHRRGGHGTPSYLTEAQAVRDWIEEQFGVVYTVGSMYTLLPRLGIRLKVPRPRHAKADAQARTAWQKGGSGPAWPKSV